MRTARLTLAPLQAADAFPLVFLTNDPLVANGVSLLRQPFTLGDAQELVALAHENRGCFASLRTNDRDEFIGCAGALARGGAEIEIGFWLGVPYHGKHYGAEAAQAILSLARAGFPQKNVVAECPRENSASWKLLTQLGFAAGGSLGMRRGAQLLTWKATETVD
jgi:RimJ/RimL family protein N-acetyltransferase